MKITIESTDEVVLIRTPTGTVPARVWEGESDGGAKVICMITRIGVAKDTPAEIMARFESELDDADVPAAVLGTMQIVLIGGDDDDDDDAKPEPSN
ncbi:MAG TPA: hypothetical protein VGO53_16520 [Steroidobacteraceae bacterium]|jgi:hypothetical protein|nr:hypothetical protein [Steroidobacteraceae bacterium]